MEMMPLLPDRFILRSLQTAAISCLFAGSNRGSTRRFPFPGCLILFLTPASAQRLVFGSRLGRDARLPSAVGSNRCWADRFSTTIFSARDDIQLNTFSRNLQIDDADIYTGAITFGLQNIRPVDMGFLCIGGGVTARAGAIAVDESPVRFDPSKRTGTPTFDYEDNGSLVGYRLEGWAAMKWRNDVAAFLKVGFGHDWTDAILGDTHSSGIVTISVGVEIPLAPRSDDTPWSRPRRPNYILP